MSRVSQALRRRVQERARNLCEYCRTLADFTGHEFTVDHIIPEAGGGASDFTNLCFCCFWCNNYKQARTQARDPRTRRLVRLFHPRLDLWEDNFRWSPTSTRLIGRTPVGRATIDALRLNRQSLVSARRIWVRHGLHPPEPHAL
ncbi:MAG TPA: HNH endonuclease [Blastocatellia bacterium]|nr:HNH endonuclease [Blastocatellia bacterium]